MSFCCNQNKGQETYSQTLSQSVMAPPPPGRGGLNPGLPLGPGLMQKSTVSQIYLFQANRTHALKAQLRTEI